MDKWTELRETIQELYEANADKPDVENVTRFLLNLMDVLDGKRVSEWLEDSDPGQEYGTTWACRECGHSLHEQHVWNPYDCKWRYCPWCGRQMNFVTNTPVDEPKTLNDLLRQKHWIIGV